MLTVEEATLLIQKNTNHWQAAKISGPLVSDRDYPPFDRVMMDGIAVNFSELEKGTDTFKLEGIAPAGEPQKTLKNSSHAIEVMTGAPLPLGTDTVIQYEHLSVEAGLAKIVVKADRKKFDSVHFAGSDCKKGEIVLSQNEAMNGPHKGIAASMGYTNPKTNKVPKIMIISTGDELVDVDKTPLLHQIRRSNAHALKVSLELNGFTDVTLDHLNDNAQEVAAHYQKHSKEFDVMIYSGGVSKGKFDYLPNVWIELGVTKHFHEVSQRPGKPLWFGTDEKQKTTVLGLPGNPVSSLVCLHRYFIPNKPMFAKLSKEIVFEKSLTFFVPVKIEYTKSGEVIAHPLKIKNSGEFTALAGSDGFIELPKDQSKFEIGCAFSFIPWRSGC